MRSLTHLNDRIRWVRVLLQLVVQAVFQILRDVCNIALVDLVAIVQQQQTVETLEHLVGRHVDRADDRLVVLSCLLLQSLTYL